MGWNNDADVLLWIALCIASVSFIAAMVTLGLIRKVARLNGYLLLVASLTVSEALYDVSYLFLPFYWNVMAERAYLFLSCVGGLTSTLWSNCLMMLILEVVMTMHSVDVMQRVRPLHFFYISN